MGCALNKDWFASGQCFYGYVDQNPVNKIDPKGLDGIPISISMPSMAVNMAGTGAAKGISQGAANVDPQALNMSIGAGGSGVIIAAGASADSGLALDLHGNICAYSTICGSMGGNTAPITASAAVVVSVGTGQLCSSQIDSKGPSWSAGDGVLSKGQIMANSDGSLSLNRTSLEVAPPIPVVSASMNYCRTTYACFNN